MAVITSRTWRKGFTLIEVLVVIGIISVITSIGFASTNNARNKGRDERRKEDLKSIASSLLLYYQDKGAYPPSLGTGSETYYASDSASPWIPELTPTYLNKLPKDPKQASIISTLAGAIDFIRKPFKGSQTTPTTQPQVAGHTTNTAAHWKFNESSGTTAADSSGNGITGTLVNGPVWTTGQYGNALSFDGTNDYVNPGLSSIINPPLMTAALWLKGDAAPANAWGVFLARWPDTTNTYHFSLGNGSINNKVTIYLNTTSGTKSLSMSSTLSLGVWHHIAFTYDGANIRLYIDGALDSSTTHTGNIPASANNTTIGAKSPTAFHFKGQMDDLRIYDYARSAAQIVDDMNNVSPSPSPSPVPSPSPSPTPVPSPSPTPAVPSPSPTPQVASPTPGPGIAVCQNKQYIYCYWASADRSQFVLWAQLDNSADQDIYNKPNAICTLTPPASTFFNHCVQNPS